MSLRASVAIRFEIPERPLAERLSGWLVVFAVLTVGWVSTRHGPPVLSVAMAASVAAACWCSKTRTVAGGRSWRAMPGPGNRVLGQTVVLDASPDPPGHLAMRRLWLTRADLPADTLRRLAVSLPAVGRKAVS